MNAEQHHSSFAAENATASEMSVGMAPALSAMADGEVSEAEFDTLMGSLDIDALPNWHAYQVIGDALRGHVDLTGAQPAGDFLAAVRIGLASGDVERAAVPRLPVEAGVPATVPDHQEAANDAVFRWKMVAGLASLAAVMAVSWSVVSGSGSGGAAGAQLASNEPGVSAPATVMATVVAPPGNPSVAVNTGQGVLIRDAQLEALLAEHRQHGGMSALQTPSGFIRNATYDAAGR
ncbi:sigma-E factor negative regulatory protein [Hydrogenophaga sp.]|uniref:sigma-E factor negative regulatory protein n=1 Tax=Hydrogenophaga sp. TaxID=1904254 RepID=UPI00271D922B|nr:sigma-E factor negative regulatory protein [Hydrogenophaga sp.]MDO9133418.1 sigma-E factor negative regulatory protein [Hydrogenophaga sp.]